MRKQAPEKVEALVKDFPASIHQESGQATGSVRKIAIDKSGATAAAIEKNHRWSSGSPD
jgi:hypothetical protein